MANDPQNRRLTLDLPDELLRDAETLVPFVSRDPRYRAIVSRASRAGVLRLAVDVGLKALALRYGLGEDAPAPGDVSPAMRRFAPEALAPTEPSAGGKRRK